MHRTFRHWRLIAVIVAVIATSSRCAFAADETVATSLADLRTLFSLQHVSFKCKQLQYAKSPVLQNEMVIADNEYSLARDSERWRFYKRGQLTDLVDGKLVEGIQTYEVVADKGKVITVGTTVMKGMLGEAAPPAVMVDFDPKKAGGRNRINDLAVLSMVFGSAPGDGGVTLADIFTKQQAQRKDSEIDGVSAVLLEVTESYGQHKVWLDAHGFPLRVETTKTGSDLLDTTSVDSRKNTVKGRIYPFGKLVKFHQIIDDMKFNSYSNTPVLTHYVCTATYEYENNQILTLRTDTQLSDVKIDPTDDSSSFKISTPIPNGKTVTDERNPQSALEWKDGEITPKK